MVSAKKALDDLVAATKLPTKHCSRQPQQMTTFFSLILVTGTLQISPEAYSKPCHTSKMKPFVKIVNG